MAKAKKTETVDLPEVLNRDNVELHLDVDPNDPRLVAPAPALPSLDDKDQQ